MIPERQWRYLTVLTVLSVLPIIIIFQLVRIQTNPEQIEQLRDQKELFIGYYENQVPPRGLIYDRWGNLLAGDQIVYEVGLELRDVEDPKTIALATSLVLEEDAARMLGLAMTPYSEDAVYMVLSPGATAEQVQKLQDMKKQIDEQNPGPGTPSLAGLRFIPVLARVYPEKSIGSNIIGFVNRDGSGVYGVEQKYDSRLAGKTKRIYHWQDPTMVERLPEVPDGTSLVLTIDREIQASMEDLIDLEVSRNRAESGTIVVMNPKKGEVLAMATTPRMDLNEYWNVKEIFPGETPYNRAVSQAYEPGSVFKVLTMAAGLDSGAVKPDTQFLDKGYLEIGGTIIKNWNEGAWGPQDMTGCMQHSLNVCLAWVALQMGPNNFYSYMNHFGIGHLTGIDLAYENPGRLKMPGDSDWYEADLGTNAFGQGVSATPLQMASAVTALANDGKIVTPHIVYATITKDHQTLTETPVISAPIRPETARTITEMLATSLEIEASDALVTGYRVAGKTGTAEIATPLGYTSDLTNTSFVGWGPVDDPQFLVYVWLEKPQSSIWGSEVASPIFRQAVERLVVLLDLPPDDVRTQLTGQ